MANAHHDPHVLVSARAADHEKLVRLPSDSARWAWIVMLGEAKLQRPAGRFASEAVLRHVLGRHARYVRELLATGLLHRSDALCERCRADVGEVRAGEIIVHDWRSHQERRAHADRVSAWRESRRGDDDVTPVGDDDVTPDVTPESRRGDGNVALATRAGARPWQSQSQSIESSPEETTPPARAREEPAPTWFEPDPLQAVTGWLARERRAALAPGSRMHTKLAQLVDRRGAETVIERLERSEPDHDGAWYVAWLVRELDPFPPSGGAKKAKGLGPEPKEVIGAFRTG